ncbi:hypothetical protein FHEFKHOI_01397 [Candidatus Methanoperedenaceae archaeon GB50]|nr:MAG: hypothetical protein KBONHNOK_00325 [Candidatus Methanoperedenaceae archaeon GB50]CAD7773338.1 hypothetical protein AIOGIFDO_01392 [Candidatus Methanoperedenaceae archaeon GB37]CAD7773444.1 hypothetical protein FHEFKHOI_01397 [Candidatus Methanoperedenaceae archaeon GB50]
MKNFQIDIFLGTAVLYHLLNVNAVMKKRIEPLRSCGIVLLGVKVAEEYNR